MAKSNPVLRAISWPFRQVDRRLEGDLQAKTQCVIDAAGRALPVVAPILGAAIAGRPVELRWSIGGVKLPTLRFSLGAVEASSEPPEGGGG